MKDPERHANQPPT